MREWSEHKRIKRNTKVQRYARIRLMRPSKVMRAGKINLHNGIGRPSCVTLLLLVISHFVFSSFAGSAELSPARWFEDANGSSNCNSTSSLTPEISASVIQMVRVITEQSMKISPYHGICQKCARAHTNRKELV